MQLQPGKNKDPCSERVILLISEQSSFFSASFSETSHILDLLGWPQRAQLAQKGGSSWAADSSSEGRMARVLQGWNAPPPVIVSAQPLEQVKIEVRPLAQVLGERMDQVASEVPFE